VLQRRVSTLSRVVVSQWRQSAKLLEFWQAVQKFQLEPSSTEQRKVMEFICTEYFGYFVPQRGGYDADARVPVDGTAYPVLWHLSQHDAAADRFRSRAHEIKSEGKVVPADLFHAPLRIVEAVLGNGHVAEFVRVRWWVACSSLQPLPRARRRAQSLR
jgi:hypothetical protein